MTQFSNKARIDSLKGFKRRRDSLLNEDPDQFKAHLKSLLRFLKADDLCQSILNPALENSDSAAHTQWWQNEYDKLDTEADGGDWDFPADEDEEFLLQYQLLVGVGNRDERNFIELQNRRNRFNNAQSRSLFLSLIARPFCLSLGDRLEAAVGMPSQEARELDAVPIEWIPAEDEIRIFLCHKSDNKATVMRYHKALEGLGFDPWLDESDMPAGTELDRGILDGVKKSCAVVFFLTEEFVDENVISDEINYAKRRKREQGNKFALIALKFSDDAQVPELLQDYIYKSIENDLDGLYEIVRALPIELGPVRWKQNAVK